MISKLEWQDWRESRATRKLVELIEGAIEAAKEELYKSRGEVADFQRGVVFNAYDILNSIRVGENLYIQGEEE